ncbi:hypothetical protein TTHERM_00389980 (macronuclear) [Tetrahymena thermophila SB210]|uniref:Uncharacterized protein n=1 Tax=Tetrahymena thermophila (strain SB210) TaxID=312017 RepID=Q23R90_TETTS|nr:hypothetical protein TTHERM_00389980 [Tetrahymena thermophila SB210]EAR99158.2 hypothetical protein TTHERM_00389980 [Tetrahymena thermophila SB210]|eukprot:XP_001019403.2 hypothetical protein TTHERM_00389980 [Tetrahymena thermophila SB210]
MSFYNFNQVEKEDNLNFTGGYYDSYQFQMNSNQEQSQINESQQSIIKKLLYNECPFNAQMSDYQKKLLLNENSRLTMQTAQKLLYQEQQGYSEYDTHSRKSEQKQRNRVGSSQFTDQKMVKTASQQMNYINQNQQQNNKNIWDELYEKGLKKKMMVELQMKQGEQEKIENETQDLTFQPKLVADNSSFNINQPFQERINNWQDAKNKRLAEIKKYYTESEDHKQVKECTFQPQILNKSRKITYEKIKKQQNENLYSNCESQQTEQESQIKKNNMSSYKQINLTKQEFNKKKNILHNQLQNLEIDL